MNHKLQNIFLISIIIILLFGFAIELMYIEEMFRKATMTKEEQCEALCSERGEIAYFVKNSCFCKGPIKFEKRVRCFWNVTFEENEMLSSKFNSTSVRNIAVSSVVRYPIPVAPATRIFSIFNEVVNRVYYVPDPYNNEYVAFPLETWESKGGDCDDISVLLASLYEAVGFDAYIVEAYKKEKAHVFVMVKIDQSLDAFLKMYKRILERYTPYYGTKRFYFYALADNINQCEKIEKNIENNGDMTTFYMVVDGTSSEYPGYVDPATGYDRVVFLRIGE
ncbi:MAG: transglutaminase domain-containing protein [Candidatus Aenigmarchaeota archaeon]|nr:transglutaminase domain-containing protein [Candidatus Aenigmarchaeota archaeon]